MTATGKAHFYQLTKYDTVQARAYLDARKQTGEIYLHQKLQGNGRDRKPRLVFAVFRLADEKNVKFEYGKSKLLPLSEMEKVE